jgi:uncharacterized protein (DUF697 family)
LGLEKHLVDIVSLSEKDIATIKSDVKDMKELILTENRRGYSSTAVSNRLTRNAALKSAGLGGLFSVPAGLPGLGTVGSTIAGAAADTYYLTKIQAKLCYGISAAFETDLDREELKTIIIVLIGFAGTANAVKEIVKGSLKEGIEAFSKRFVGKGVINSAEQMAEKLSVKTAGRALPLIGIPIGAAANYYSTMLVGRKAKEYFRGVLDEQKS